MAAGKCKAAYYTDEWHGYGCSITEGACMFIFPDSKACAEKYGEGPDAVHMEEEHEQQIRNAVDDVQISGKGQKD